MMRVRRPYEVLDPAESRDRGYRNVGLFLLGLGVLLLLLWGAASLTGTGQGSLVAWVRAWFGDQRAWSAAGTLLVLGGLGVLVAATATIVRRLGLTQRYLEWKKLRRVDQMAPKVAGREDELELREKSCRQFAQKVRIPEEFAPGCRLGTGVTFRKPLYVNYEYTCLAIVGPRQGKTTALCVPMMVEHAGPVLGCTNKPDLHFLTRGPRSQVGRVWVHDMQQIAQQEPDWYWDPLMFIVAGPDMATRAARLAGAWQSCYASPNASSDAYFGPGGETLLANLLLVCALEGLPVAAALEYLRDLEVDESDLPDPVNVLRENGFDEMAHRLKGDRELTPRQRDGLVGTAQGILSFLSEPVFRAWITPDKDRQAFEPADFVRSKADTLLLLSKNVRGPGGRAVVTALTMAVTDAAVEYAQRCPGGRIPRPLLLMLDEAANICPWPELPDLYSYLGSHGVIPVTILQNKAQGVKAWGKDGMDQLVSSANVMLIGGGINDSAHLRELVELIGERQKRTASTNRGHGWRSHSTGRQVHREQVFDVRALGGWPRGRLIAFSAGALPVILKTVPWQDRPYAEMVEASKEFYEGAGESAQAAERVAA